MMFRVFQVDDSTIVDCFTGVARSDVILSFFFHTIRGHGRRTGIDRSDSRKAPQKVKQDESSCPEHVGWPRCMADSLNQSYDMVLLPKTPKHQTFEESWDGILASSFTTLLICMPMLDHWCIFLVASPAISEISQISIPI